MESNLNSAFIVQRTRDACWKTRSCYVINDAFTYWWLIIQELIGSLSTHGRLPSGSGFLPPVSLLHLLMFCSLWPCPSFAFLSFCNNGEWAGIFFFFFPMQRPEELFTDLTFCCESCSVSFTLILCSWELINLRPVRLYYLSRCLIDLFKGRYFDP